MKLILTPTSGRHWRIYIWTCGFLNRTVMFFNNSRWQPTASHNPLFSRKLATLSTATLPFVQPSSFSTSNFLPPSRLFFLFYEIFAFLAISRSYSNLLVYWQSKNLPFLVIFFHFLWYFLSLLITFFHFLCYTCCYKAFLGSLFPIFTLPSRMSTEIYNFLYHAK